MGLHGARSVEVRSRTRSPRDRLVVLIRLVAEREVVHRPLRCREHAERAVERVGDRLRRFHIAGDHGGRITRIQHRAFGDHDRDRLQASGVHRNVIVDQRAKNVEHRRLADRRRCVEIGPLLSAGAGKVDRRGAARAVDGNANADRRAAVHWILECAVLQRPEYATHRFLGVVLDVLHIGAHNRQAEMRDHLDELVRALRARRDLRAEIGDVLIDVARRITSGPQDRADLGIEKATLRDELHIVEQHALFVDVRRIGRHRSGRDAADIRMMTARSDVEFRHAIHARDKHGCDDGDVRQMRPAVVRRIQHERVAFAHRTRAPINDGLDRFAHRAQMSRHMRRIGDQIPVDVEQRTREVEPLLDVD